MIAVLERKRSILDDILSLAATLTRSGRAHVVNRFIGAPAGSTEFKNVGWGTGIAGVQATAAASDVNMFSELPEARVAGTSSAVTTTTTNDTYQVTATITASAGRTVNEGCLTSTATKPQANSVAATSGVIGSSVSTDLKVASAAGFPGAGNYFIQVRTEVMTVTGGQGTTTWVVTRGTNGSTAIATIALSDVVTGGNGPNDTAITNGDISVHFDFGNVILASGDSIAFTIKGQVS